MRRAWNEGIFLSMMTTALMITACGSEADEATDSDSEPQDAGREVVDMDHVIVDAGEPEVDEGVDAARAPDMAEPGVDEDAGDQETDADQACDPEQVAASLVGAHQQVEPAEATFEESGAGWRAQVDASVGGAAAAMEASFVYLDLDQPSRLMLSDEAAIESAEWEIAFKRTEIRVNSADSGPRGLMVVKVEGADFEQAMPPGAQGGDWKTDDFVSDTCEVITYGRGALQTAIGQWYDYDPATHGVSAPAQTVYFLYDPSTHAVVKFQIESYDAGVYTLRWE